MPQGQPLALLANYFLPLVIVIFIFYILVYMPQKKQEKEHRKMLSNLDKNNDVITSSGIHGTIVNVKDKTVILRIDDNAKIEIEKTHIVYVEKKS